MNDTPAPHPDARAEAERVWLALRNMGVQVTNYQVRRALLAERPAPTPDDETVERAAKVLHAADDAEMETSWLSNAEFYRDTARAALIAAGVTFR